MSKIDRVTLYESQHATSLFRVTEIAFDFENKIVPSWYSNVRGTRVCCHYHLHHNFEMIFVERGRVDFQVSGRSYPLADQDILIINPFEPHSDTIPTDCNNVLYYAINLDTHLLKRIPSAKLQMISETLTNGTGAYANRYSERAVCAELLACVREIVSNQDEEGELYRLASMVRCFAALGEPLTVEREKEQKRSAEFIRATILYIQSTPLQEISLETAAELQSYNKAYFTTLFKKNFGMSFIDYMNHYKITMAKGLIKNGNYNLNEVAERSGFNYYAYFFKKFKLITGVTPSEFVEQCKSARSKQ